MITFDATDIGSNRRPDKDKNGNMSDLNETVKNESTNNLSTYLFNVGTAIETRDFILSRENLNFRNVNLSYLIAKRNINNDIMLARVYEENTLRILNL
ncbi:hypothetical protein [Aeromonas caviae]|uniref:hypothetical protein n=1 Tax=Aeromonas caviae TaxID=648 RepID=UPI0029D9BA73|nr:hypothetical protein [Aeromonas caviae]MDX7842882.1 hypothetical protein [Aeromonas caviae]